MTLQTYSHGPYILHAQKAWFFHPYSFTQSPQYTQHNFLGHTEPISNPNGHDARECNDGDDEYEDGDDGKECNDDNEECKDDDEEDEEWGGGDEN